ncbi:uncharacterized protein LODBEIA_P21550 [Lodderomyces beijingensis]|uniref:CST complex subunit Stn1 N-terminal domain-containing protein n=1 Tax=Lodderomyces beijingensis TaxID=1775926 RepID=A0ABP0ZIF3_9ASCO
MNNRLYHQINRIDWGLGESHIALRTPQIEYYRPELFHQAKTFDDFVPVFISDYHHRTDLFRIYFHLAESMEDMIMVQNWPINRVVIAGRIVGEYYNEERDLVKLNLDDCSGDQSILVVDMNLAMFVSCGFQLNMNNYGRMVQVYAHFKRSKVVVDNLRVLNHWGKEAMGAELEWWGEVIEYRESVLRAPWVFKPEKRRVRDGDEDGTRNAARKVVVYKFSQRELARREERRNLQIGMRLQRSSTSDPGPAFGTDNGLLVAKDETEDLCGGGGDDNDDKEAHLPVVNFPRNRSKLAGVAPSRDEASVGVNGDAARSTFTSPGGKVHDNRPQKRRGHDSKGASAAPLKVAGDIDPANEKDTRILPEEMLNNDGSRSRSKKMRDSCQSPRDDLKPTVEHKEKQRSNSPDVQVPSSQTTKDSDSDSLQRFEATNLQNKALFVQLVKESLVVIINSEFKDMTIEELSSNRFVASQIRSFVESVHQSGTTQASVSQLEKSLIKRLRLYFSQSNLVSVIENDVIHSPVFQQIYQSLQRALRQFTEFNTATYIEYIVAKKIAASMDYKTINFLIKYSLIASRDRSWRFDKDRNLWVKKH